MIACDYLTCKAPARSTAVNVCASGPRTYGHPPSRRWTMRSLA